MMNAIHRDMVRRLLALWLIAASVFAPSDASTEPEADGETLPAATEASGLEVEPEPPSALWSIGRALLFLPRVAVEVINAPIRGALYVSDRYQIIDRAEDILFNDARTFGVYPIAAYESGFGIAGGAKMIHEDLFGSGESGDLEALYGGRFNQEYELELETGERFAAVRGTLELGFRRRPRERFFGIGNGDLIEPAEVGSPLDPTVDERAIATRFRSDEIGGRLELEASLGAPVFAAVRSELGRREFARSDQLSGDAPLSEVYDPAAVVGFTETLEHSYSELEVRFDTRRPNNRFASSAMPSRGYLVAARVGYNAELAGDRPGFSRYEIDLQAYFDLYEGTRAIGLRLLAVQTDADIDEIAFVDLPRLGGDSLLRGYQTDRFRDRGLVLATAEYKFELNPKYLAGYLFVDAGRVLDRVWDGPLKDPRLGFGGGVQLHTLSSFILRAHVASSRDGGVFFNLDFNPVSEERVRR